MREDTFQGYPEPSSNTLYCPNQFFDVVLPHSSRGVVRLVGYMFRRVLGWCDEEGRPQEPTVAVSWNELIQNAGIARGALREAIDAACAARFIRCLRPGRPDGPAQVAVPALYELCWDDRGDYITDPEAFAGFYAGNGNLTYIPNAFFDHTLKTEPLSVIRVVGAIIRNTIGWQTHYGFRRQKVAVSFTQLQRQTNLSRQALTGALHQALAHHHLVRLEAGYFDPQAGVNSKPATYGIRWRDQREAASTAAATELPEVEEWPEVQEQTGTAGPVQKVDRGTGSKSRPDRFNNWTGAPVQKVDRERSKILTGDRFKKQTGLEITDLNNTLSPQQQQSPGADSPDSAVAVALSAAPAEEETGESIRLLLQQGFDEPAAAALAHRFPRERIERQCQWIGRRSAERNRLGLLRRAIEQDWPEPQAGGTEPAESRTGAGDGDSQAGVFATHAYAGWAGNPGKPTAVPSGADLRAAEPFVAQLLELWPEEAKIPEWGRQFGEFVRRTCQTSDREDGSLKKLPMPRSIVVALRAQGDAFLLEFERCRKSARAQALKEARQAHAARCAAAYTAYLRRRDAELAAHAGERYQVFVAHEQAQRQRLAAFTRNEALREKLLATFDAEADHLERLRAYFQPSGQVLDFWAWDKELNPERFQG